MSPTAILPDRTLSESLSHDGFVFVRGEAMRRALEPFGALDDWAAFAASWDALELDAHMADGGRYRRRRHAVFAAGRDGAIERQPHQPHFQAARLQPAQRRHRALVRADRSGEIGGGRSLATILEFCRALFGRLRRRRRAGTSKCTSSASKRGRATEGLPTPEGLHRDGVDYVLVLLVGRPNIASGVTSIHALDGRRSVTSR